MMKQLHWNEPELNVILLCGDVIVTSTETTYKDLTDDVTKGVNTYSASSIFSNN